MESSTVCCSLEVHHLGSYLSVGQLLSHCMNTAPCISTEGPRHPSCLNPLLHQLVSHVEEEGRLQTHPKWHQEMSSYGH